jgi:CheY-like chemotaxis protein
VDDLLDLAKVEAGKITIVPSEFTAGVLFGALRGMLRPLLIGDAVALIFEDTADIPLLDTDEGKVSQILRNFISNAIKFTEHGEVRVRAAADHIADTVTFSVQDTGIGIARGDQEVIFQEFGQVTHRLQRSVKGTGLGLPLAKKLAELLGGQIAVDSTPGLGSTFSVTVPRVYRSPAHVAAMIEPPETWTPEPGKVPVMVVEDDPADAFTLERVLAGSIYQFLRVQTIRQAQEMLQRMQPVAILLDVMLLGDETWRLLLHLRNDSANSEIPLVVMSSSGEDRKAVHLGADEYLSKPVDGPVLLDLLDRLTGRRSVFKVLLVDDEEIARYLVRQLLPRSLYALRSVERGEAGLAALRTEQPDVILLDINMPDMSGYEFLDRLHADAEFAGIPTIVLTSAILAPHERNLLHRASLILSKSSLSATALIDAIQGAIEPRETMLLA